jgi:hypothetical protein
MVLIELGWLLINPLKRGHLYFVEKGTFLLCLDSLIQALLFKLENWTI